MTTTTTAPAQTNEQRRTALQDLAVNRVHPLHTDIYALQAASRDDPEVSRALAAALSTVCAAVSALSEAVHAATDLIEEQQAR